jgi:RNA recognition motif-containing protein
MTETEKDTTTADVPM